MPRRLRILAKLAPLLLTIAALALITACSDDETINVVLPEDDSVDSLRIAQSNLPNDARGGTVLGSDLYVVFSAAMDTTSGSTSVSLAPEGGGTSVPLAPLWTSSVRLEISPQAGSLNDSTEYALTIAATSEAGEPCLHIWRYVRFDLNPTHVGGDCAEVVTDLARSPTAGPVNFDTKSVRLHWSAVSCAVGYRIFAKDSMRNLEFVFVAENRTDFESGEISQLVTLPPQFDRYSSDQAQTPFAGSVVTFAIVPMNAATGDPEAGHATLEVRDEVAPAIVSTKQTGPGTNESDADLIVEFSVEFDEFIGFGTAQPRFEVTEGGGDPSFTLNPAAGQWSWNAGRRSGQFQFALSPGEDASGDIYRIVFDALDDLMGNLAAGAQATEEAEIASLAATITVVNHDFESGGLPDNGFSAPGVIPTGWRNFGGLGGNSYGYYNPDNNANLTYPGTTPDAPGVIGTMDGPNVFYFGTLTNNQGIEQDLSLSDAVNGVFGVRRDYAVTVALGERLDFPADQSMADLSIALLAGSTVLGSQVFDAAAIPAGTFGDVTLSVDATSIANPDLLVGQPLVVRLLERSDLNGGPEVDIDNVRVTLTYRSARAQWSAALAQ